MLIVVGDCRYTLLGLSCLLEALKPVVMSTAEWMAAAPAPGTMLLVVPGPNGAMADVLPLFEKALRSPRGGRAALLGTPGMAVLLNSCGFPPERVWEGRLRPVALRYGIQDWLLRPRQPAPAGRRNRLSAGEIQALRVTLAGASIHRHCRERGISPKTFYTQRSRALQRLGLRTIRGLLANPDTGIPVPASRYDGLLLAQRPTITE